MGMSEDQVLTMLRGQWIPVAERLPETDKYYLTVVLNPWNKQRGIIRQLYLSQQCSGEPRGIWPHENSRTRVTHWCELPPLPENK
jgi:hypothetical protein